MKTYRKWVASRVLALMLASLGGCAATSTAINKRNLKVQTRMSDSIVLDPVPASQKTVFIQAKNTSDKQGIQIASTLAQAVRAKGFQVVADMTKAHYLLQVNVLQAGVMDPSANSGNLNAGFGGAVTGGLIGAVASSGDTGATLGGAVVGGIVDTVAGAMVKDVTYTLTTDVQLSVCTDKAVATSTNASTSQGSSAVTTYKTSSSVNWIRYRTRVVSSAENVNLTFSEAESQLMNGLTHSIAGIF